MIQQLRAARRVSVPLIAIQTPDPGATIEVVRGAIGKNADGETPIIQWDVARGFGYLNDAGRDALAALGTDADGCAFNPVSPLLLARKLPRESVLFYHNAPRFLSEPTVIQSIWNLRDQFKQNRRTLIMLGPQFTLPPEIAGDVVLLDEPLPDAQQLARIVTDRFGDAQLPLPSEEIIHRAVDAVQGLPAFAAEQVAAMSLRKKDGIDLEALWERKRQQIEQTPGLRVYRGGETFNDIGGLEVLKSFIARIMTGQSRPNALVFVDEVEKCMAGARGDTSGVSQDQLGSLLSYMQDQNACGMILVGPPGGGKSLVAKAAGAIGGVPTIQLDLGGLKGSLLGQSEGNLRSALKVITAVSNGKSMWIATCNSISDLPPELRRRFTLGTFFVDLPSAGERSKIWSHYRKSFDVPKNAVLPDDEGWTGAEIRQCVEIASRLACPLTEAAAFIVPVSRSASEQIEKLRNLASGRFLSASYPGVYSPSRRVEETNTKSKRLVEA